MKFLVIQTLKLLCTVCLIIKAAKSQTFSIGLEFKYLELISLLVE